MITVCIVDSNATDAAQTEMGLQLLKTCKVLSKFCSAYDFLMYCNSNKILPQIVLVEPNMQTVDGVFLTDYLQMYFPSIKTIALSAHWHQEVVEDMFSCGAAGYVYKLFTNSLNMQSKTDVLKAEYPYYHLHRAVEEVALNHIYIDPLLGLFSKINYAFTDVAQLFAKRLQQLQNISKFGLSDCELQITLLYAGTTLSKEAIANVLLFSVKKIEKDLSSIYKKLVVADRHALGRMCMNSGTVKNARYF